MRRFVIDTNIVLAYIRQSPIFQEAEKQLSLTADDAQLIVSVVTIGEIKVLAQRNGWGAKKIEQLEQFFETSLLVVDINIGAPELLDAYVEVDCFSVGKNMGKNDLWIAATAIATKSILVTTDADFDHLHEKLLQVSKISVD